MGVSRRQSSSAKHPADLAAKRVNKRVRCFLCNSEEKNMPRRADTKEILARSWPPTGKILSNSRTFEKFPLKNIFKRHIHRVLSFNFFSRQRQRRSMRHASWSSCVVKYSHISSRRACLFGALDSARNCIFLPAGLVRSSGTPWIVHRGSVGRKNSVNRSYINYVYVALCHRHHSAMRISYRTLISLLATERFIFDKREIKISLRAQSWKIQKIWKRHEKRADDLACR